HGWRCPRSYFLSSEGDGECSATAMVRSPRWLGDQREAAAARITRVRVVVIHRRAALRWSGRGCARSRRAPGWRPIKLGELCARHWPPAPHDACLGAAPSAASCPAAAGAESITSFGERVSQFMENPLQGAKGAVSSVLTALGPFGVAVTTGAAVLGTIAVSAFEAAKSLGEYGTRVKDAELRTGLAAKEVGQFGFAARAVGQDISIVERLMRGLSQAADDNSQEGEKVRATLRGMGIDLHTATGEMKPTSEILTEISEGLNKLPEGLQRDAAGPRHRPGPFRPSTNSRGRDLGLGISDPKAENEHYHSMAEELKSDSVTTRFGVDPDVLRLGLVSFLTVVLGVAAHAFESQQHIGAGIAGLALGYVV